MVWREQMILGGDVIRMAKRRNLEINSSLDQANDLVSFT